MSIGLWPRLWEGDAARLRRRRRELGHDVFWKPEDRFGKTASEWAAGRAYDQVREQVEALEVSQEVLENAVGLSTLSDNPPLSTARLNWPCDDLLKVESAHHLVRTAYFSVEDVAIRRKLIETERAIYAFRQDDAIRWVEYWQAVIKQLDGDINLATGKPTTSLQAISYWITIAAMAASLIGAGWWMFRTPGAIVGGVIAVLWGFRLESSLRATIPGLGKIRKEYEESLQEAIRLAQRAAGVRCAFTASEEQSGRPEIGGDTGEAP